MPVTDPDAEIIDAEVEPAPPQPAKRRGRPPGKKNAPKTNGELAVREVQDWMTTSADWPHQWVDFEGDHLAVRKPTQQALAAFSLAMSRFVSPQTRNDITGLFISRHLSDEAYSRVFDRLMDGDDPDYDNDTVGALMRQVIELTTGPQEDAKSKG